MSRDHRKLRVFHDAHALAVETYRLTRDFPREEQFGLRSQMRRAAVSVAANIVEGSARGSTKDYVRFLQVAFGSGCELQFLFVLTGELGIVPDTDWASLAQRCEVVLRQLHRLIDRVTGLSEADTEPDGHRPGKGRARISRSPKPSIGP
jgi:four helix bundle protein